MKQPKFIDDMAIALSKVADGVESPPRVEFDIRWVETTTFDTVKRSYRPVITFSVIVETEVELYGDE